MSMQHTDQRSVTILRWIARVWGIALLLFWGAFFVEHLTWFADLQQLPAAFVFLMQAIHLAMLVGLVLAWRSELLGGTVVLVSSLAFFSQTAGANFALFFATSAAPALVWIYCGWYSQQEPCSSKQP
jgi:hypothetical protein